MADLLLVVVTALLSAALTGAVLYWLWSRRVFPELEAQARAGGACGWRGVVVEDGGAARRRRGAQQQQQEGVRGPGQ